ncbi:MAG: ATP-dependent 6-phosphofructokinase [Myxococcales bacterium]|nr:ATP-dependent 6-phosphofructokinase [Myxococcales bacterium]
MPTARELEVPTLGPCRFESPLHVKGRRFEDESTRVRLLRHTTAQPSKASELSLECAGARRRLFFDPPRTTAAFVTCGGLSPGLNNVIRSGFLELKHNYGVERVLGIRNGYSGLNPESDLPPEPITPDFVRNINYLGGTVLGSSRGAQEPARMVDFMESQGIDILFCIGGDGTQRGAHAIADELAKRGHPRSIIGIPKTIDNDVRFVDLSFGFLTALEEASEVLRGAHVEAVGARNGVGLVKLMGREAGFIAVGAALASQESNFVLVPEVPFPLDGEGGFLDALEQRILARKHALVVVAEGAGQHLFAPTEVRLDASGNRRFEDIGIFLKERIAAHFKERNLELNLKYIDPSYAIRSVPANAWDRVLTDRMARGAVHAAMAGKTNTMMGYWNQEIVHVPISTAIKKKRRLRLDSDIWNAVLATTGQPNWH